MKKIQTQLKTISKSLVSLSKQVEKITNQVDRLQPSKKSTAKRKPTVRKAAARKKAAPARGKTVLDTVFDVIKRSRKGVTVTSLKDKTGLDSRQLSNALYKLSKKGMVYTKSRGLYIKS